MMRNKRGWIKIVEAFIAVLLIAGVLLFVINKGYIGKKDISEQVYKIQLSILREIELNSSLRFQILDAPNQTIANGMILIPVPDDVKNKIHERMPSSLICTSAICPLGDACPIPDEYYSANKDVYAQAVAIAAETDKYNPRQLKLFCWSS